MSQDGFSAELRLRKKAHFALLSILTQIKHQHEMDQRLHKPLFKAPGREGDVSSLWIIVVTVVLAQLSNDCFGWLEDYNIRLFVGVLSGYLAMVTLGFLRGGRI